MVEPLPGAVTDPVRDAVRTLGAAVFETVRHARPTASGYLASPLDAATTVPELAQAVVAAFASDPGLAPLAAGGEIEHADGSGSSWGGPALPNALVKWARDRLLVEAEPAGDGPMISRQPVTEGNWLGALDRCVHDLRSLLGGSAIEVPVAVSLAGLPLPGTYSADLPGLGRLRRPTDYELAHSELVEDPTAILCRSRSSTMTLVSPPEQRRRLQIRHPDADDEDRDAAIMTLVAGVLTLGPEAAPFLRPSVQAVDRCNPLHGLGRVGTRRDPRIRRDWPDWSRVSVDGLPQWAERVANAWTPDVSLSARYLLRALREPRPEDALIAARVSWDSLESTGHTDDPPGVAAVIGALRQYFASAA